MLSIKTVLLPFNLNLSERKPISLRVETTNDSDEETLLSMKFVVSKNLSVEKTTIASVMEKRIGLLKPHQTKLFYLDIYPKVNTSEGIYPGRLIIYEHYNKNYDFVAKEYKKDFTIRVIRT